MSLPLAGAKILAADLEGIFPEGVDAWETYTPTLTQSGAVAKTVTYASYMRVGRLIVGLVNLFPTATGTASNAVNVGIPVASAITGLVIGSGIIYDSSAGALHKGIAFLEASGVIGLLGTNGTSLSRLGQADFTAALAAGDQVSISFQYPAAS